MSTKPGWAAWRKPVVCRPCRFASQRHKRTWLLCNNPLQQPPCGSYSHAATRDENPSQPHQAAALSAPELGSEPRSAAACRSELDEAGCANREVPGRCRLTPHGAAERQSGGARTGTGTAGVLCPSRHPRRPGRGARGGTACAPQEVTPGDGGARSGGRSQLAVV